MPASMTQFFNPFFIVTFGSLFSWMWMKLNQIGKNPSIPMKFSLGIFQLGLGFLVTLVGFQFKDEAFAVPILTLVFLYMLHTTGELFVSPIGLSMVTKLAPKSIAGTAMGGWFLSFAMANFLAGQIAALTGAEGHEEEQHENIGLTVRDALKETNNAVAFEDWVQLENGVSPNVTMGNFENYAKWAVFRKAYAENWSTDELGRELQAAAVDYDNVAAWLDADNWTSLKSELTTIAKADSAAAENGTTEANIDYGSYNYYGFDPSTVQDQPMVEAYKQHVLGVSEKSLDTYMGIFSTLGYVLLGLALLLALLRNPINKLMHGVE